MFCSYPKSRENPKKPSFPTFFHFQLCRDPHRPTQSQTNWALYWNLKCRRNESTEKKLKSVTVFVNGNDYSAVSFIQCEEGSIISELKCWNVPGQHTISFAWNCIFIQISNHFSSTGVECWKTRNEYERQSNAFVYSMNIVCFATGIHFNLQIAKMVRISWTYAVCSTDSIFHLDIFFE